MRLRRVGVKAADRRPGDKGYVMNTGLRIAAFAAALAATFGTAYGVGSGVGEISPEPASAAHLGHADAERGKGNERAEHGGGHEQGHGGGQELSPPGGLQISEGSY